MSCFVILLLGVSTVAVFPTYKVSTHPTAVHFSRVRHSQEVVSFVDQHSKGEKVGEYTVIEHTYRSSALSLSPGEVVFTEPKKTLIDMPKGKVAILGFKAEVVDSSGRSVPLYEVYNHHWLVFDGKKNAGVCGGYLAYKFGVGAESRNTPVNFPAGYGVVTEGDETWGANIHLLRTVNITGGAQGVKDCIECNYYEGRGCSEKQGGTFACCEDGSFCKTDGTDTTKVDYYLQYTVKWTDEVSAIKPVDIYVLDGSNCQVEYNVYENPSGVVATQHGWEVPVNGEIILAIGHQHVGGENISLLLGPSKSNLTTVCTSRPVYGASTEAGNEKGYVVQLGVCSIDKNQKYPPDYPLSAPIPVHKGDTLSVLSYYSVDPADQRSAPLPGGSHGGVMALFYVVASRSGEPNGGTPSHFKYWYVLVPAAAAVLLLALCCYCRSKKKPLQDPDHAAPVYYNTLDDPVASPNAH